MASAEELAILYKLGNNLPEEVADSNLDDVSGELFISIELEDGQFHDAVIKVEVL